MKFIYTILIVIICTVDMSARNQDCVQQVSVSQFLQGQGHAKCIHYANNNTKVTVDEFLQGQGTLDDLDINSVITFNNLNLDINDDKGVRATIDSIVLSQSFFNSYPDYLTDLETKTGSELDLLLQNLSQDLLRYQQENSLIQDVKNMTAKCLQDSDGDGTNDCEDNNPNIIGNFITAPSAEHSNISQADGTYKIGVGWNANKITNSSVHIKVINTDTQAVIDEADVTNNGLFYFSKKPYAQGNYKLTITATNAEDSITFSTSH